MIHDKNFKFTEKTHRFSIPYISYISVVENEIIHNDKDVGESIEFNITISNEKPIHIFEYFGISVNKTVEFKRLPKEIGTFIVNQFPNEVLFCNGRFYGIWYSDVCSDELKTMIDLMGNGNDT